MFFKRQRRGSTSSTSQGRPIHPPPRVGEDTPESLGITFRRPTQVSRFEKIKKRRLLPTRYLDFELMEELGIREDIEWLAERLGWMQFIHLQEPTYKGLTLEFLSSFNSQVLSGPRCSEGLCTFRLGNEDRSLDLQTANTIFGFPSVLSESVPRGESRVHFCHAEAFWREIGSGNYDAAKTKATTINNPALRIFHRFMAHTIFGRGDGGENSASKKEVYVMCAALHNHSINSAGFMMGHLSLVSNKAAGEIVVGGLVTRIARHFAINLEGRSDAIAPQPIGATLLRNMKLLYQFRNRWYWALQPSNQFLHLPCPARTTLQRQENWKLTPRRSDFTQSQIKRGASSSSAAPMDDSDNDDEGEENEEEEEDENEGYDDDAPAPSDAGPSSGDPRLYSLVESMQQEMTLQFSQMNARIDQLHDKFDEWRAYGWQYGPPPPPPPQE